MPNASPASPTGDGYDIAFKVLLGVLVVAVPLSNLAWLSGNLTARFTGPGPWAPYRPIDALLHPDQLWPAAGETSLLIGTRIIPTVALIVLAATVAVVWSRHKNSGGGRKKKIAGMAKAKDIEPLMAKAITAKARSLRPSLKGAKHIDVADTGVLLGNLQGTRLEVRMGYEDVAVAIMAPRSGKTTSLAIPSILNAPGPVLLTSNKAAGDAYTATVEARRQAGRTWSMDPQQIAHAERQMWWNPLADAKTLDGAGRLAGHFLAASVDASQQGDFWSKAGSNILSQLFLAAALDERPITDVMQWLAFPADRTPLDILRDHGFSAVASQLKGTVEGPPETRDGIYETARQYAAALLDSEIAAWVTPQPGIREFIPAEFVTSTDTLYLLSKDGGGGASALIAACADSVMRAATAQAERAGGRLDPPMLAILDEAANVCKISDLPDLYSHLGSRGIIPITILQSYRQGQKVWGDAGMDAMWSASTVKVIGSGIDDPDFADKLSRLIGDHDVETTATSSSNSGKSTSVSMRQERILPADAIRALPKGTALLFATGMRAAMLDLRPWYAEPGADALSAASARASKGITSRAVAKHTPEQSDNGPAARPPSVVAHRP
ncbi:type IV secretory system conjugative DNA transfer family protein [Streptomyces neyagawaensis]|uniref:type IV secretory system conjugative DNA transfer family protein n=1 Tax=Streptomyces neyagawaensis TaxID=42238 RepID=UPI00099E9BEF|nr:type IV secretory system conjugative DNA transfer family protein [Streptomyces neyagawaensis]MCL6737721.1 TraM recognition domain-containing protein [Streptomyces neyagawaensis]MDE1687711.1 TraM recognition domain-containing protein [Streptomyces neyagawaensis]MDG5808470.1 TraM recognition domain-containing protein [Streptomyces ossamyceticus]